MSRLVRLSPAVRELRIILCQNSPASAGVREFITTHYVDIKKTNPTLPILIRECSNVKPTMFARFSYGREKSRDLTDLPSSDVLKALEDLDETHLSTSYAS